jgi:hypothetical protein
VRPATPRPPLDAGVRPADGPATAERGWLQVAGPGLARARVVIDGVARGYAPNPIEVPVGRHQVVLERDDGTTVGPFAIEVTPFHTRTRPLRPSL